MSPEPQADPPTDRSDELFAAELRRDASASEIRRRVRERPAADETAAAESHDLLRRVDAMEFVDSLVGVDLDVPERLGDYRITGLLGRGGMGTVYAAFQESLERHVALKVLSPAYSAQRSMRKRFRIEARATAALHHQHIVPIYDYGEAGGCLYFAMEKVEGVSLDHHLALARKEGRRMYDDCEVAARFAGVADALAHAHRRRILHRDVKPGNVLVHPDGSLALADFGLSKTLGEASVHTTQSGPTFLGTLQYASPEQARGQVLSAASDLYALGVTLFEVITGELPYRADSPEALLDAVLRSAPRPVRSIRRDVSADLAAVVDKLLQKEVGDRYTDAAALATDLRRVADGVPVRVRRASLSRRLWRRMRRNPWLSAVTAATVLLAAAVAVQQVRQARLGRRARFESLLQRAVRAASDEAGAVAGPSGLLSALVGGTPDPLATAGADSEVLRLLAEAEQLMPGDAVTAGLVDAYRLDPLPAATALLREGRGVAARRLLDIEIERRQQGLVNLTAADQLVLYRLFAARAIASLTAGVGEPSAAREDLQIALLFRRSAFVPRLLVLLLEAEEGADLRSLRRELEVLRARIRGPQASATIADLLLAWAGAARRSDAHLMPMPAAAGWRRALYDLAFDHFGAATVTDPERDVRRPRAGVDGRLHDLAVRAAAAQADAPALSRLVSEARQLLEQQVGSQSSLRAWRFVFDLLQRRERAEPGDLDAELLERAVDEFLALPVPPGLLWRVRAQLEQIDLPPGAARLRTRAELAVRLDGARAARPLVEEWMRAEPLHPRACLARLRCYIDEGGALAVAPAGDAAVQAWQRSVLPEATRAEVVALLAEPARTSAAWRGLRESWERRAP